MLFLLRQILSKVLIDTSAESKIALSLVHVVLTQLSLVRIDLLGHLAAVLYAFQVGLDVGLGHLFRQIALLISAGCSFVLRREVVQSVQCFIWC